MPLHRYIRRQEQELQIFGDGEYSHTYDFEWYRTSSQIGIKPNQSQDASAFCGDFLRTRDALTIDSGAGIIQRGDDEFASMDARRGSGEEVRSLIDLLKGNKDIYAFTSRIMIQQGLIPCELLTFSTTLPDPNIYKPGKKMKLVFQ